MLIADAVSKHIVVAKLSHRPPVRVISHALTLDLTRNSGAAFSVGTGATVLFSAVAIAVVVVIARTPAAGARAAGRSRWACCSAARLAIWSTGSSARPGRPGPCRRLDQFPHWPVFNLADSAIVIGGLLAVVLVTRGIDLDGSRR